MEYYTVLHGRSEREIMLATEEIRKRQRLHSARRLNFNAKTLAIFLESVEAQEVLLVQRACDRESAAVRSGNAAIWFFSRFSSRLMCASSVFACRPLR